MASKAAKSLVTGLALLVGAAGVAAVLYAWRLPPFTSTVQTTDDAYVRGAVTTLGSQLAGTVAAVHVQDFQAVKAGDVLLELDGRIFRQKLEQARASLASAQGAFANFDVGRRAAQAQVDVTEAQIRSAQAALQGARRSEARIAPLVRQSYATPAQQSDMQVALDQAEAGVAQAEAARTAAQQQLQQVLGTRAGLEAAVQAARAAVELAAIDLGNTRVTAPQDGRLGEVRVRPGQYVTVGTQLVALVPAGFWIIANYKETQIGAIRSGQAAEIRVDALGRARLIGHVGRFSPATGSEFSVLRPDNATGNFIKIPQRILVRIELDPGQPLAERISPGLSAVVSIETAATP